jgi:archaellum biogenesis ATPase FlaH
MNENVSLNHKNSTGDEVVDCFTLATELETLQKIEVEKVFSNIPSLDKAIEGFIPGELIVISGPTKHGKTLLAQSFTAEFVKQNVFPLWFSFEVPPRQFLKSFPELPLFYLPRRLNINAINWMKAKMDESFNKYHTRVIFIDHLHYLFDIARTHNPSIEIGNVIRQLKTIAVLKEYIIFLLCHTRKGSSEVKELTHESIRDSSFVSQESDCVLLMIRNTKNPESNEAKLKVEFHRRLGVLNKVINLVKVDGYLRELEKV